MYKLGMDTWTRGGGNSEWGEILGNPRILGQGGGGGGGGVPGHLDKGGWEFSHPRMILGWGEILGNPRILVQGEEFSHPRMILGWRRYLGIPGYLDKGGGGGGGGG